MEFQLKSCKIPKLMSYTRYHPDKQICLVAAWATFESQFRTHTLGPRRSTLGGCLHDYFSDQGRTFDSNRGGIFGYGWSSDNTSFGRDRGNSSRSHPDGAAPLLK